MENEIKKESLKYPDNYLSKAKQILSIISTATLKDEEIKLFISAGILELERSGVDTSSFDELITTAIMMYVKANFGNVDIKNKELAQRTFDSLEKSLSQSENYRKESDI